jgi:hypothetical protein
MRENPNAKLATINENMVLAAMPGTVAEIERAVGMTAHSVGRIIKRLRAANKCFVGGHEPPHSKGCKWVVIHHAGAGNDVALSAKRKKTFKEAAEVLEQERRKAKRMAKKSMASGWAAALMVGIEKKENQYVEN